MKNMKKYITGIVLFSISFFSSAELIFVSEILVGQSQNTIQSAGAGYEYNSTLDSDSFAFRIGIKVTENLSFELAKHDHGTVVHKYTAVIQPQFPGCCIAPEDYIKYEIKQPIETSSLRLGIKGELEIITDLSVIARLGLAHWDYDEYTPQDLVTIGLSTDKNGNDIYYSLGAQYKITESFYLGVEYSVLPIDKNFSDEDLNVSGFYDHTIKDLSLIIGWQF